MASSLDFPIYYCAMHCIAIYLTYFLNRHWLSFDLQLNRNTASWIGSESGLGVLFCKGRAWVAGPVNAVTPSLTQRKCLIALPSETQRCNPALVLGQLVYSPAFRPLRIWWNPVGLCRLYFWWFEYRQTYATRWKGILLSVWQTINFIGGGGGPSNHHKEHLVSSYSLIFRKYCIRGFLRLSVSDKDYLKTHTKLQWAGYELLCYVE